MTIRVARNWCSSCEEVCHHHPTVCTVCGTVLQDSPAEPPTGTFHNVRASSVTPIPEFLRDETRIAGGQLREQLRDMVSSLRENRQRLDHIRQEQFELAARLQQMQQEWQTIPPNLLDPQQQQVSRGRPTSRLYLEKQVPRMVLHDHSPLLCQATLKVNDGEEMSGIFADFEGILARNNAEYSGTWVMAQAPRTGLGGISAMTQKQLDDLSQNRQSFILCFQRGDGITFVQKALLAQKAGAVACIIANHVAEPWPYIMQDSIKEATRFGLTIPTVMISKADADKLWTHYQNHNNNNNNNSSIPARLALSQPVLDCIICTDALTAGDNVVRLPLCGHVFHTDCVLPWLRHHNTCPYCRRELPTDDAEYEQERRRMQRTHAGSDPNNNNSNRYADFYG